MKPLPKWLLIVGIILCLGGPMVGLVLPVLGMIGAFHDLGNSGIANPQDLSHHIGTALTATMAGLLVSSVIGFPCVVTALVIHFTSRGTPPPVR